MSLVKGRPPRNVGNRLVLIDNMSHDLFVSLKN